jgi:DNA modification methylase
VRRVLRDDGSLWLNIGDSYAGSGKGYGGKDHGKLGKHANDFLPKPMMIPYNLKPKDLVGIPWRVAFALQADGWYLRSDIIWAKPNPMPESVTDRPTKAHEYIFLLSKRERYFYDAEAIREPAKPWNAGRMSAPKMGEHRPIDPYGQQTKKVYDVIKGANRRTVWTIATQPFPGAHFATFPPKLIEPCILAGSSPRACEVCGSPWERVMEKTKYKPAEGKRFVDKSRGDKTRKLSGADYNKAVRVIGETWQPTCSCENEGRGRCTVLDPFAGSGTTLWVAEHYGRDSIGIEINPEYCELIKKRMNNFQQTIFQGVTV